MKNILSLVPPAGLEYRDSFLKPEEQAEVAKCLASLPLKPFEMRGVTSKRQVGHFGWDYAYDAWTIQRTTPIPDFLLTVRTKAATLAQRDPQSFEAVLINSYPLGAGIGWHRDAPMFGDCVLGVSLFSECRMKFRREQNSAYTLYSQSLAPGSLYVMAGESRKLWQHCIAPAKVPRYSITFRTIAPGHKQRLVEGG